MGWGRASRPRDSRVNERANEENQEYVAEMASLNRNQKLGKGKPSSWAAEV